MKIPSAEIPQTHIDAMEKPVLNDLAAFFVVMQVDVEKIVARAEKEGWNPEQLIDEIERLIDGDNRARPTDVGL